MDKSAGFDLRKPFFVATGRNWIVFSHSLSLGLSECVVLLFTPLCRHEHACRRFVVRQQLLARAHEGFDVLREAALVHFVGEVRSLHYTERRNDLVVNALPPKCQRVLYYTSKSFVPNGAKRLIFACQLVPKRWCQRVPNQNLS